ncbi:MAG TPA: maleylpyruvate isomerase N-terminal domain-containing protein, partial [Actinomycetota bacterium]|nr:maleylpyruvate isomerase N-terminal domain-containing protein [Actinomycetota bacterium]
MSKLSDSLAELEAEHGELEAFLAGLSADEWSAPTPAEGWDVRDQVSHLADTNEICVDTVTGGPRPLNETALSFPDPESFTQSGVERGRAMSPADVLAW